MSGPIQKSIFAEHGLKTVVAHLMEEIQLLYMADDTPWIVGYSGGKDSSATLQVTWKAIAALPKEKRTKPIHVVSTDTLVENPVVAMWVGLSLDRMAKAAIEQDLPIKPNRLMPRVEDSFWVNLIGKGYPAPRHKFRWCTERLKIRPSNAFIMSVVKQSKEAILLLGARKQESNARAKVLARNEKFRARDRLSPNSTMSGCMVYTPIEDWSNDDVWTYLTSDENPWGHNNKDLLGMYAGASADGECPLVVDTSTPSCGDSRFGCWVCTLVEEDKSMAAMVRNDHEKKWMKPMLDLRNALDFRKNPEHKDHLLRDFRRMGGNVTMLNGEPVPGPYTQSSRENWLRLLLKAQSEARRLGPEEVKKLELVTLPELHEIRRIWVTEKHELEDNLPVIFKEMTSLEFPGIRMDDSLGLKPEDFEELKASCEGDHNRYEMIRDLIGAENNVRHSARRTGLMEEIDDIMKKHLFGSRDEAKQFYLQLGLGGFKVEEAEGEEPKAPEQPIA
jgi:DNA sulfur modification protein DndC